MKRQLNDFIKSAIETNEQTTYQEIEGDLIQLAKEGRFDVITHGCNCLSNMGAGIAPQMAKAFGVDKFWMESWGPSISKLGCIDYETCVIGKNDIWSIEDADNKLNEPELIVVNSYTQFRYGKNHTDGVSKPLDYEALTLCMRKINQEFSGKHIGLPKIGAGLAGGDWNRIKKIIQTELKDMKVSVVIYKP
jgi:O-acetyl-ADP-ribose deacetylase (regulator of RNase III)